MASRLSGFWGFSGWCLCLAAVALVAQCPRDCLHAAAPRAVPRAVPAKPLVAVMVSDDHYDADKLLPPMLTELAKERGWELVVLHGHGTSNFPNIEVLDKTDTLVIFVRRLALPKDQLAAIKKYVVAGRGIVALRTACHGFESRAANIPPNCENWPEFDKDVLGGNYHNHGDNALGSDVCNVPSMMDSPILRGVKPDQWHSVGAIYFTNPISKDATVYQTASSPQQPPIPLTWTRMHGTTRVAFTALGHQKDFEQEAFRRLVANLIDWTIQKENE